MNVVLGWVFAEVLGYRTSEPCLFQGYQLNYQSFSTGDEKQRQHVTILSQICTWREEGERVYVAGVGRGEGAAAL